MVIYPDSTLTIWFITKNVTLRFLSLDTYLGGFYNRQYISSNWQIEISDIRLINLRHFLPNTNGTSLQSMDLSTVFWS